MTDPFVKVVSDFLRFYDDHPEVPEGLELYDWFVAPLDWPRFEVAVAWDAPPPWKVAVDATPPPEAPQIETCEVSAELEGAHRDHGRVRFGWCDHHRIAGLFSEQTNHFIRIDRDELRGVLKVHDSTETMIRELETRGAQQAWQEFWVRLFRKLSDNDEGEEWQRGQRE